MTKPTNRASARPHSRARKRANPTSGSIQASLAINALARGLLDEVSAPDIAAALAIAAVTFSGGAVSIEQGGANGRNG
ncbi:MAG: hypothetical protein E5Y03_25030 [Mesorhizobium sp.]|uniref:hypothetical protein n=1 Tax=Mesorhizobium sp. TaxID=1871066 RepID=UPI00120A9819|nr:hypothetical protein [Mesorhizobium sp.]TIN98295.1 MAG: hypothetical protein E5Y03_25030 [Mesorhizobium sp.]